MYRKIMVPVDLAHVEAIRPALQAAADLGNHYGADICYVSVTPTTPTSVAHTPEEYETKLEAFAKEQGAQHGRNVSAQVVTSSDPASDLDDKLVQAIKSVGADLVVMATHLPRKLDAIMPANGGKVATHTDASIFLVRP